jgi:hypothetical protein
MSEDTPKGELILYQTDDGLTQITLKEIDGNVWLTQAELAELFDTSPQNITLHLKAIYEDDELDEAATCKDYLQVRSEGDRRVERKLKHYNLSAILAVGFRVRSPRGTQFRRWANTSLREYLIKGFVMNDERLKDPDADYFEELLARIRDIRSSEKLFYKKVLDIYATSVDYDPSAEASQLFFQTVQNKMHWAAHGHTAAEIVVKRADADKDHMGLTSWANQSKGGMPRKADAVVAKNYLSADELEALNRIVTAYLEFAELQAMSRKPMTMQGWITRLDDFLKLGDRDVLTHAGKVTARLAKDKGGTEYDRWHTRAINAPSPAEAHFLDAIQKTKQIAAAKPKGKSKDNKGGKK